MLKNRGLVILVIVLIALAAFLLIKSSGKMDNSQPTNDTAQGTLTPIATDSPQDQFSVTDEVVGTGQEAKQGDEIVVNYKGTLEDGTVFDSSYDRGTPFSFTLGAGEVIEGWDKGFDNMRVGGKRKLIIPSSMGYGAQAVGSIPANSTLIFEVELVDIVK